MKEYKVYLLKDTAGEIVYVGMTSMILKERLYGHNSKGSKFCGKNLTIELFDTYKTKEDALHVEAILKQHLGFRDEIICDNGYAGKIGGKSNVENQKGFFDPKHEKRLSKIRLDNMKKANENRSNSVLVYTLNGQFVGEYPSQSEAARELSKLLKRNINRAAIRKVLKGDYKQAYGHIFKRA
jgi:predicted GIY-YIG superfamily endonuclease